jgi:hypothetical protein
VANEKKVVVEVPERLAKVLERLLKVDELGEQMASGQEKLDWRRLSSELEGAAAATEREISRRVLRRLDEQGKTIAVDGKTYRRVGRYEGTYYTKAGPVMLKRTLYRDASVRNDKTVDAISLKLGCVEDGWLPETADAMACLLQSVPGAEAEKLAKKLGRVTYSASSFKRVGSAVGHLYEAGRNEIEDVLIAECVIPDKTRSLTVSLDRVALPMEIDVPRKPGRPKKNAPKRSVARVYEMAWVGTVSLVDGAGETLHTIRYGATGTKKPESPEQLLESMQGDVKALLARHQGLKVTAIVDGAKDIVELLDTNFSEAALGVAVVRLVDFWHVIEKLGKAATTLRGADEGSRHLAQWKLRLLNNERASRQILRELEDSGLEWKTVGDTTPIHEAITYLTNNADRMNYAAARAAGLNIGSGTVEATCKSLVQVRMCRSGARWRRDTAQALLSLRALALSDRWDSAIALTLAPLRREVRRAA